MHTAQLQSLSMKDLDAELDGPVITPSDAGYDAARTVFHGGIDRRPAAIARVATAGDVARVVRFAYETGLELAVRGGGHSAAGHGVTEGGIVLDLRDLRGLAIDLSAGTAWADTGLTTGEYTAAAATCRLATGFGDAGSVGIGGITLAGGVGHLARKHGLTIDNLLAAEVVTADGALRRVDADYHPDLFWGIRGGGGNFGVATRLKLRLHELGEVVGGQLVLPATPEVIAAFVAAAEAAPDELSTTANMMPAPPLPFLPSEHHGRLVLMATLVHAGAGRAAERAVAPFRALAAPLADTLRPMPYPASFRRSTTASVRS
jgi:FAD/FMN-containing dehydrogenase